MLGRIVGETVQLDCQCADGLPAIKADESNLEQVLMNLVVNARDAMPNGGRITISAGSAVLCTTDVASNPNRRAGSFVIISVADEGCGMDEATQARIFEPFFTTKGVGRGTGLGLSTVYGIVEQHEGWVEVKSAVGAGSTFSVYLPALDDTAGDPTSVAKPAEPVAPVAALPPGATVFVVEDEAGVRKLVVRVLTRSGFKVIEASSGPEAMEMAQSVASEAQLLLTDMVMPGGMSGGVLASKLMALNPKLKVVYTSGYSPEALAQNGSLEEGLNFLPKPFTRDELVGTVTRSLQSSSPHTQEVIAAAGTQAT
jgi:CheY-like chemotaxis protein